MYGPVGTKALNSKPDFQIIAAHPNNAAGFANCTKIPSWNTGYLCNNRELGILMFESMDADKKTRLISPVYVQGVNLTSRNILNTFMDHMWDGFYTSLKRLSRFPTLFQGGRNTYYNLTTNGTLPNNLRFSSRTPTGSAIFRLKYATENAF